MPPERRVAYWHKHGDTIDDIKVQTHRHVSIETTSSDNDPNSHLQEQSKLFQMDYGALSVLSKLSTSSLNSTAIAAVPNDNRRRKLVAELLLLRCMAHAWCCDPTPRSTRQRAT